MHQQEVGFVGHQLIGYCATLSGIELGGIGVGRTQALRRNHARQRRQPQFFPRRPRRQSLVARRRRPVYPAALGLRACRSKARTTVSPSNTDGSSGGHLRHHARRPLKPRVSQSWRTQARNILEDGGLGRLARGYKAGAPMASAGRRRCVSAGLLPIPTMNGVLVAGRNVLVHVDRADFSVGHQNVAADGWASAKVEVNAASISVPPRSFNRPRR